METRATAKYIRIAPAKIQRIAREIRGLAVDDAAARLRFMPQRAARVLEKVLKSAVANAENNADLQRGDLVVAKAFVDRGPVIKRMTPRARGRADVLTKKSSHVTVIVGERR